MSGARLGGCCGNPSECHWKFTDACKDDGTDKTQLTAIIRPVCDIANRPEEGAMVCVFGGRGWAKEAQYAGGIFYAHSEESGNYSFALPDVNYWQPLPPPPNAGQGD